MTGKQAVKILTLYFKKRPDIKIVLAETSPVKSAYDFIEDLGKSKKAESINLRVYGLAADLSRFASLDKFKGEIKSAEKMETTRPEFETGSKISGTLMRQFLKADDKENFIKGLPKDVDSEAVWKIVSESQSPNTWAVPADSFNQQSDPNISPSTINTQVGGLPMHWTTSQPYSRFDLKTNPLADRYGRNPSQKKIVKSFEEFIADK